MCWLHQSAQLWSYPTFLLIPLMILAFIECFAGYRAWRFLLGVNGAFLGCLTGAMIGMLSGAPVAVFFSAIGGAAAGAFVFITVVPLGSFIFAFSTVASLAILLARVAGAPAWCIMPVGAIAGLAAAVAAILPCRSLMIAVAAVAGAQQLASAWRAYHLPYNAFPALDDISSSESAAFIALAVAGLLVQFALPQPSSHLPAQSLTVEPCHPDPQTD